MAINEKLKNMRDIHNYAISKNQSGFFDDKLSPKPLSIYRAGGPAISFQSPDSPKKRDPNTHLYKNFNIIHNSSVNNSNIYSSPNFQILKNDPSAYTLVTAQGEIETFRNSYSSQQQPINSAIKESNMQLEKINKMLEEHRKKKAQKSMEDSSMSSPMIAQNYLQEMKERLSHRISNISENFLLFHRRRNK